MPELPEVESVRRGLEAVIVGLTVTRVRLMRADVVAGRRSASALLLGATIARVERHGKQLALIANRDGRAPTLCFHLGMTGQLVVERAGARNSARPHEHARWTLAAGHDRERRTINMVFRDPRRFGGVWTFDSDDALRCNRWCRLGPDALGAASPDDPSLARLWRSARSIKSALLEQSLIAGVGNIYADEALFRAAIRPRRRARALKPHERQALTQSLIAVLREAIEAGGSTLRDYQRVTGEPGSFQNRHRVYGRAGLACTVCGEKLRSAVVAQRTTVWCSACQR